MFSHESTENLLENLESDLAEVLGLDNSEEILKVVEVAVPPPVAAKRGFVDVPAEVHVNPVPAARRLQSMDKNEKNDENEIIQLSSISSSSTSENHRNISQNTIVRKTAKPVTHEVVEVHEAKHSGDEQKFHVTKHGKWAIDEKVEPKKIERTKDDKMTDETEMQAIPSPATRNKKQKPQLKIVSEKPKKNPPKKFQKESQKPEAAQTSFDSDSESTETTSTSEETLKAKKKPKKKQKNADKKRSKKPSSDDQVTSTENSKKAEKAKDDSGHAIGIFLHATGPLKFSANLKCLRVKVSFYNEDSAKQISDSTWSKAGSFNNDFYNLICTWNEMLVIEQDFKRLKEIYNNVLVFFEVGNSEGVTVCWAFLKLFSPKFANIDDKFQLQLFQKLDRKLFFASIRRNNNANELTIFEQWRSADRRKFSGVLNVSLKVLNQKREADVVEEPTAVPRQISVDSINRKWQKLPGQACKIPNKISQKIPFHEKGSMNVKFSQDGNLIAFSEVTKDGSILHIQKFPEMLEIFTMLEHSELIHDIDFLKQKPAIDAHQWMLTCSSDFTAIVWKLEESSYTYHILPHPSFVYASKFLQSDETSKLQVVTAGRDCFIRIWSCKKKFEGFELVQEMKHPNVTKASYITTIATRNTETFYTANSHGVVIEWTLRVGKDYHLNRVFKLDEIAGSIITSLELHPRGNKIFLRVQDFNDSDVTGTIFAVGVPTGMITQRHQQPPVQKESQGKLKVSTCGTHLFSSNGTVIRFYSLSNGAVNSSAKNHLPIKIPSGEKISAVDYHPKDFYFACSIYGRNGGVIICNYESETDERDLFDKLKSESREITKKSQELKATGTHFSDIIRKLDEVFLAPIERDSSASKRHEITSKPDDTTFSVDSKRSGTYTVSQGPATYTIQRSQNDTYEIQRKDESDDDTTISESFN